MACVRLCTGIRRRRPAVTPDVTATKGKCNYRKGKSPTHRHTGKKNTKNGQLKKKEQAVKMTWTFNRMPEPKRQIKKSFLGP